MAKASGISIARKMDYKTELPQKEFRWENGCLEQLVEVIQHKPNDSRDVGIFHEWHPVLINGKKVLDYSQNSVRLQHE